MIDGGSISLPGDSIIAPVHQVSIKADTSETDELRVPDDEEASESREEWTISEQKFQEASRACQHGQDNERKATQVAQKEHNLLKDETKRKKKAEQKK